MKDFLIYFFGIGSEVEFENFSAAHFLPILAAVAVIAYFANSMIGPGANYLFMAKPEDTPSVLDILPPNFALRIGVMAAVISLMFAVSYLPWYCMDRKAKKSQQKSRGIT